MSPTEVVRFRPRVAGRVARVAPTTALWLVLVVMFVAGSGRGEPWWVWTLVLLLLMPTQAIRWSAIVETARRPWAVEIGPVGVRWHGSSAEVAWTDLDHVEVRRAGVLLVTAVEAAFADRAGTARARRFSDLPVRARPR